MMLWGRSTGSPLFDFRSKREMAQGTRAKSVSDLDRYCARQLGLLLIALEPLHKTHFHIALDLHLPFL